MPFSQGGGGAWSEVSSRITAAKNKVSHQTEKLKEIIARGQLHSKDMHNILIHR